jgi:hypothetical protein
MKELDTIVQSIQNRDYDSMTQFIQGEEVYQNASERTFLEELTPKVCLSDVGGNTFHTPFINNA